MLGFDPCWAVTPAGTHLQNPNRPADTFFAVLSQGLSDDAGDRYVWAFLRAMTNLIYDGSITDAEKAKFVGYYICRKTLP